MIISKKGINDEISSINNRIVIISKCICKNDYPKKIGAIKDRYDSYTKKVDSNNPIFLGITSIIQANNIAKGMDLYLEDKSNKDKLKEAQELYNSMYQQLVKDCGKI
ncbi:hypothetical protein [Proteus mirabilis]|uniref:hypothetical protein n=1 Tax=Proteus mirabilis TaxID=584 RepID=UPI002DBDDD15|nr:hypothetical protein [Proteus mirabilis]MEC3989927.1 hypothetical protein [Proteus mirabilis]MEC4038743.1 hypothetical protein [Proteus mirabilis]MEC4066395.1 hypothetical protein [Proteus mirabilis]MEC4096554.1 hypothetical protein [Proteus mirabilis]